MGVVFQAEDTNLKRLVALKAMVPALAVSASARERFKREAVTAAQIDHDHIVHIYQVGEDRGVPYLAMQFLKGEPLDERLRREPRLPVREVLRIGREIAQGLAAAHEQGLIHRDIKPANIWLESRGQGSGVRAQENASSIVPHEAAAAGRVKILDFGLARAVAGSAQLTQSGAIVGTPAYMAPEQAGKTVDHRCDLFSLGCVLYRMSTGRIPFEAADTISTLLAVATEQPRTPGELNHDLPPALSDLIMRLLAKRPDDRPPTARAVIEGIQAIEAEQSGLEISPKKLMAAISAGISRTKWMKGIKGRMPGPGTPAGGTQASPSPRTPVSVPPPVVPLASRRRPPYRPPAPLPRLVPRRRRSWFRLLLVAFLVILGIRLAVNSLPGPIVIEADGVRIGDKKIITIQKHKSGDQARECAEAYLAKHFESPEITDASSRDSNRVIFRGTGITDGEKKRFRLEVRRKHATAPWEAGPLALEDSSDD
jgi:serine/threonine protein kinase